MFLKKKKYTAAGAFEKLKARLVAGGDRQDKSLYADSSSPRYDHLGVRYSRDSCARREKRHHGRHQGSIP